jgi:NADH dehydrogenase/NADH:ubiquinone oxidoreductase subunit G
LADLARAKAALRAGKIKAVVLLGVDPAGLDGVDVELAKAEFTAVIDLFPTTATARADVVVPLAPLQEEDGSVVSFDGRITAFKRVFKPLAGFGSVEFLAETLAQAAGDRPDLPAVRQAIAAALPLYRSLPSPTPTAFLCDEAARHVAPRRFAMAQLPSDHVGTAYQSATTFSRATEARLRASMQGDPVTEFCHIG